MIRRILFFIIYGAPFHQHTWKRDSDMIFCTYRGCNAHQGEQLWT
jgi:hypothetical protein